MKGFKLGTLISNKQQKRRRGERKKEGTVSCVFSLM